jgi:hypothetical protein
MLGVSWQRKVLLAWENEGVEAYFPSAPRSTFQVSDTTSWSTDLTVETSGHDVVNHAGATALRLIADRTGLTTGLSQALARRGSVPVHDPWPGAGRRRQGAL